MHREETKKKKRERRKGKSSRDIERQKTWLKKNVAISTYATTV